MLLPHAASFPLRFAVRAVIVAHVALARAVRAFVSVSRREHRPAQDAGSIFNGFDLIKQAFLALKEYGRVPVHPIAQSAEFVPLRHPNDAREFGLPVRARSDAADAYIPEDFMHSVRHTVRGSDVRARDSVPYVNASVTVEQAPDEVVQQWFWECGHGEPMSLSLPEAERNHRRDHDNAANGNCRFSMVNSNSVGASNICHEAPHMVRVLDAESQHDSAFRYATIGREEAEPVGFALCVDALKKRLVKRMYSGACHGLI